MALAMTNTDGHTPQDIAGYQVLLDQRDAEIARQSAELLARDLLIEKLKLQLANLRRQRFGTKSEALDQIIDQLELAIAEAEPVAEQGDSELPPAETTAKQQPTRKPLPDHIPREDVVLSSVRRASSVAEHCVISAKTYPRRWSMCPDASR